MGNRNRALVMFTCLLFMSCQKDDRILAQRKIDQQISDRLNTFISLEKRRCEVKIMEEANRIADSILRESPVFIMLDSLQRPPVPLKPIRPEFEKRKDSIRIVPIIPLKDSILPDKIFDEIGRVQSIDNGMTYPMNYPLSQPSHNKSPIYWTIFE